MRFVSALALLLLCGCGTTLVLDQTNAKSVEDLERLAQLIVVGVIERHHLES
jgi:hypothetical protein